MERSAFLSGRIWCAEVISLTKGNGNYGGGQSRNRQTWEYLL